MEVFQGEETFRWGLAGSVEVPWSIKVEKLSPTWIGFPNTWLSKAFTPEQSYKKLFPITSVYLSKNKDNNDQTSLFALSDTEKCSLVHGENKILPAWS